MKKKLYFVVEKEISSDGETINGMKVIDVYEIIDNEPKKLFNVEGFIEDKSTDLIKVHLEDNGMGDDEFEFVQL